MNSMIRENVIDLTPVFEDIRNSQIYEDVLEFHEDMENPMVLKNPRVSWSGVSVFCTYVSEKYVEYS